MLFKCLRNTIFTIALLSQVSFALLPGDSEDSDTHCITGNPSHSRESQKKADLQLIETGIIQVKDLTEAIEKDLGEDKFSERLAGLGKTFKDLSWNLGDPENLRNKHGYRNRHKDQKNKRNTTGAQIDFETLQHLGLVAESMGTSSLYTEKTKALFSLVILKEKLVHIEASENPEKSSSLPTEHNKPTGILLKTCAYVHDLKCLHAIKGFLEEILLSETRELDYTQVVNRFYLAFLFVQMGETAKELSDFLKPETVEKDTNKDGLRYFFKQLGEYRQFIKDRPHIVIFQPLSLISRYNNLILYSNEIMAIIGRLISCLEDVTAREAGVNLLNRLDEAYKESGFLLPSDSSVSDVPIREISVGLKHQDSSSGDDYQGQIHELENHIVTLEKRMNEIVLQLKQLMALPKEVAKKPVESTTPFERLHHAFNSSKSPVKHFLVLYKKQKSALRNDTPDPLEDPSAFEDKLQKMLKDETRSGEDLKNIKALLVVFSKCKMANVKKTAEEFQRESGAKVPLTDLQELASFLSESKGPSKDGQNEKNPEAAKELCELDREERRIKKKLTVSKSQLASLERKLRLARNLREKEGLKQDELVSLPAAQDQSEPLDLDHTSVHATVDGILRVYAVLASFEYQQSRAIIQYGASAMAVGFLGKYYNEFFENHELIENVFIERSPVAASMVSTKAMRNERIMHNVKEFDPHCALDAVQGHVNPWKNEMVYLREYCAARQLDMKSYLVVQPVQRRAEIENCHYTSAEERVFLTNITLKSLVHFVRPYIALEFIQTHQPLESDDNIPIGLFLEHQILTARVYQQIGDAASLTRAMDILTSAEEKLHDLDCNHCKDRLEKWITFDKAVLLLMQEKFEEAAKSTSAFLVKSDLGAKRTAHMMDMIAKVSSSPQSILTSYLGTQLESLANATYFDVFTHLQQLCAYYTTYGDYRQTSRLANFMELILKTNESHIKSVAGQSYEHISGVHSFIKGTLLFNRGIAARDKSLIQQSAREYEKLADYLQRTQPEAEYTKSIWYRVARSWLFIEDSPVKSVACFEKSGAFVSGLDSDLNESEIIASSFKQLLFTICAYYLQQNFSNGFLQQNAIHIYDCFVWYEGHDLIGEMKILMGNIHNAYITIADKFVAANKYSKAKEALRYSSLASHIVRFVDREIIEYTTQLALLQCERLP